MFVCKLCVGDAQRVCHLMLGVCVLGEAMCVFNSSFVDWVGSGVCVGKGLCVCVGNFAQYICHSVMTINAGLKHYTHYDLWPDGFPG